MYNLKGSTSLANELLFLIYQGDVLYAQLGSATLHSQCVKQKLNDSAGETQLCLLLKQELSLWEPQEIPDFPKNIPLNGLYCGFF